MRTRSRLMPTTDFDVESGADEEYDVGDYVVHQ
jgi:hypothetical protein